MKSLKRKAQQKRGSRHLQTKVLRRSLLAGCAATAPMIWLPNPVFANQTTGRGSVKHLIYVRLSGGFRFTAAFNGDVANEFNPFGLARSAAPGTEWGMSAPLSRASFLEGESNAERVVLGMKPLTQISNKISVLATVDHEPFAGGADGNHGTGLDRYQTGFVGGDNSIFTMIHYGLRARIQAAAAEGRIELPPFVLGSTGMARGAGKYAAYRPPTIQGENFEGFAFAGKKALPEWANAMAANRDRNMLNRQVTASRSLVEAYMGTRESTEKFAEIFNSDILRVRGGAANEVVDGITNSELETLLGDSGSARRARMALRLFHFGSPAVFFDEGGYDMHSQERERLPERLESLARLISGLEAALKRMRHPSAEGGSYWDHTLVVFGSEFGRSARGNPFNSAQGSDHGGDRATRWMSMPFMGGAIDRAGMAGKMYGRTAPSDLKDDGRVFSYRSVAKTLMDLLCADHSEFFPADAPITDLF